MSATLRSAERPDGALFSTSVGPTVITNSQMPYGQDFTLTAGASYTFTVTLNGVTLWTKTGVAIADGHIYALPNIGSADSGGVAGSVALVV